ncbi:hypothetical protein TeGR_g9097, partial [Tetraparma gracilis]
HPSNRNRFRSTLGSSRARPNTASATLPLPHTHTSTLLTKHSAATPAPAPQPSAGEISARTQAAAFKSERNSLISDLSGLWEQITFLEGQLTKAHSANNAKSSQHRSVLDDVRERMVAQEEELEALKKQHREDATQLLSLTRQLTFSHAEERRLRHLASSKNLAASKTKTTFAKMSAEKLTQLNLAKTRSDARGDDLAASIVDLKRHHTKREGELVSQVEDLTSEIGLLKAEIAVKKHAHESASERCEENLSKNSVMVAEMNEMKETERVMKRAKEHDDAEIERLRHKIAQDADAKERELKEWKARCIKAEAENAAVSRNNVAREKELDRLRDRLSTAINDAEGEVSVSRAEAEALKERCIALDEQNEALVDRYREAETILRKEGLRFDGTMKRLVAEMREKSSLSNSFLEERHLLNKQWEKREKEIVAALKREARRVELKEEECTRLKGDLDELEAKMREAEGGSSSGRGWQAVRARFGGTGGGGGVFTPSSTGPQLPSVLEKRMDTLLRENAGLKKENERLMNGMLDARLEGSPAMGVSPMASGGVLSRRYREAAAASAAATPGAATPAPANEEEEGDADASHDSGSTTAEASNLYQEFKSGGTVKMASEVRNMVSESGKLLRKIEEYETLKKAANTPGGNSVATADFKSPYLFSND